MDCAPVRSTIPSLKLGDYLSVQAHNLCSISHLENGNAYKGNLKEKVTSYFGKGILLFGIK